MIPMIPVYPQALESRQPITKSNKSPQRKHIGPDLVFMRSWYNFSCSGQEQNFLRNWISVKLRSQYFSIVAIQSSFFKCISTTVWKINITTCIFLYTGTHSASHLLEGTTIPSHKQINYSDLTEQSFASWSVITICVNILYVSLQTTFVNLLRA